MHFIFSSQSLSRIQHNPFNSRLCFLQQSNWTSDSPFFVDFPCFWALYYSLLWLDFCLGYAMALMTNVIHSPICTHRLSSLRVPPKRTFPANFVAPKSRSLASKALNSAVSPSAELSGRAIGFLSCRQPLKSRGVVHRPVVRAAAADADGTRDGFDTYDLYLFLSHILVHSFWL